MGIIFKIFVGGLILPGIIFIKILWTIRMPIPKGRKICEALDKISHLDDKGRKEVVFERMLNDNEKVIVSYSVLIWFLIVITLL